MREKIINYKIPITSITEDKQLVKQTSLTIQEHDAQIKYKLLAKNRFNGRTIHCPGYFNNKINFILGEKNSILSMTPDKEIVVSDTSDLIDSNNFMIYPIPCFNLTSNTVLEYTDKLISTKEDIKLTYKLGESIGQYFIHGNQDLIDLPKGFLELFINTKKGISLNKNILINTNPEFVLGILNGYFNDCDTTGFYILPNLNIYTFSTIFNYLGASYSIRNSKNDTKKVYFQLPVIFENYIDKLFVKNEVYVVSNNQIELVERYDIDRENLDNSNSVFESINNGKILLVPYNSIDFIEVQDERVYDLTAERHDATNYSLGFTPFLKNSDGDILAISGIFTKEGIKDSLVFSPDSKEYYKDLNDGTINQWIADDAILGLYNVTK